MKVFQGIVLVRRPCVSTSIAEVSDYAMYEPWLFGKAVFGRRPSDLARRWRQIRGSCIWISVPGGVGFLTGSFGQINRQCEHASAMLKAAARFFSKDRLTGNSPLIVLKNGALDFGCLDATTQFAV